MGVGGEEEVEVVEDDVDVDEVEVDVIEAEVDVGELPAAVVVVEPVSEKMLCKWLVLR